MTLPTDDIPWEHLVASLGGTLPADEERELEAWVAADPSRRELLTSVQEIWDVSTTGRRAPDVESALVAIRRERDRRDESARPAAPRVIAFPARRALPRWSVAAAAAAVLVAGWWGIRARSATSTSAPSVATAEARKEYATSRGQRVTFKLPDGTSVALGPESRLRYSASYGERDRVVELDGEGRFDVVHNAERPFAVLASDALIRDIGTDFVVRARADEPLVVAVSEGIVALGGRSPGSAAGFAVDSIVLHAGDVAHMTPASARVAVERGVTLERYLAWSQGRLVFTDAPLARVVAELGRWFDADVQLRGTGLGQRRLTAAFGEEPVDQVLSSIAASFDLTVERIGRRYVLSAR